MENNKELLKDLCMRLPYKVVVKSVGENKIIGLRDLRDIDNLPLPYLRPMSSMTEEEKGEYRTLFENVHWATFGLEEIEILSIDFMECYDNGRDIKNIYNVIPTKAIDWLLENHFDFRGLIPKDLAIEVTEENNPYNV